MSEAIVPDEELDFPSSPRRAEPDAHGQAALILAESILHALIEVKSLTVAQAIEVVRTACEVKIDVADETGESEGRMQQSLALLAEIKESLVVDKARD